VAFRYNSQEPYDTPHPARHERQQSRLARNVQRVLTASAKSAARPSLVGRNVVVTGGGRGIGAATAIALAEAGAAVALAARNEAQVVEVAAQLRREGRQAFAFRCDVTDPRDVRDLAMSATEAMGRIDILVNNAGTATSNPLGKIALSEWEHIMAVNATGTFLTTQAMYPAMVERGWGRIVNIASLAGVVGERYIAAYVAAKHAVVGFTKAVAAEAESTGVTVNAVCPGYVDTPLTDETIARIMHLTGKSWHDALRAILTASGQPRLIRASEVAEVVLGLCSDQASARQGEIVVLDGAEGS
jgi:3-hydroxybutyrate dehydrogenase